MRWSILLTTVVLFCVFVSIEGSHKSKGKSKSQRDKDEDDEVVTGNKKRCGCWRVNMPVCGSDNRTYRNNCILKCYAKDDPKLTKKDSRACKKKTKFDSDTDEDSKGTSGSTSDTNDSTATDDEEYADGLALFDPFREKSSMCDCPSGYNVVCADDNKSYKNKCYMECYSAKSDVKVKHNGWCYEKEKKSNSHRSTNRNRDGRRRP